MIDEPAVGLGSRVSVPFNSTSNDLCPSITRRLNLRGQGSKDYHPHPPSGHETMQLPPAIKHPELRDLEHRLSNSLRCDFGTKKSRLAGQKVNKMPRVTLSFQYCVYVFCCLFDHRLPVVQVC